MNSKNSLKKKKYSKGEFVYLARVYNNDLFERTVRILEEINKVLVERRRIKGKII